MHSGTFFTLTVSQYQQIFRTCVSIATDSLMFLFAQYRTSWLATTTSHWITCQNFCVQ